jgi:hypothetical protein
MESPVVQRDRSLDRLRTLTIAAAVGATGLTAVLSMVAATTLPGQSSGGSANLAAQGATQNPGQSPYVNQDDQSQNPFAGILSGGGGAPVAVSGGSHP